MQTKAVILAAGQGTRMKSSLAKVLHPLLGLPMIHYAVDTALEVTGSKPVVVVGHSGDDVRESIQEKAEFAVQEPQLGTGHAVMQARELLDGTAAQVLVTYADMPLLQTDTLRELVAAQQSNRGSLSMLTLQVDEARGFGRVMRDQSGKVTGIIEEAQATPEQLSIKELNAGVYCFDGRWLWQALPRIDLSPKGEYYLTDLVAMAVGEGLNVEAVSLTDPQEAIGINNRVHLAEAEAILRQRINKAWMIAGVTISDPATTYIEPGVDIGQDTVILPKTHLQGTTRIGEDCQIGPNTIVLDTQIGNRCRINNSVLESAILEDLVDIGPFAHLRKGAHLARGVHMGNFGEVKNSYLGPGTKMGHFSYMGDATTGADVNIGAGTITCNYDGERKHPTDIEEGAFIGSDTMLVAPVKIGRGARTGAGSVVTRDVPPDTVVAGVPARAIRKLEKDD